MFTALGAVRQRLSRLADGLSKGRGVWLVCTLAVLVMTGCAAQRAFNDAQDLNEQDNVEAALPRYEEAIRLDPDNMDFRLAYARAKERSVRSLLERADRLSGMGKRTEAEGLYRRVLAVEPNNARANGALQRFVNEDRREELLQRATVELERKDNEAAKLTISTVLRENPKDEKALSMMAAIEKENQKPRGETILASTYKKPLSIEFKDAPLKQVLDAISRASGLNIILDKDVKTDQKTSIFLKNGTIEAALYYMLMVNQLEQQVLDANTLLIYPGNAGKQKDYQQLVVKSFMLANASAKTVGETLKTILKTKDMVVDEKLNMIILRDSAEAIGLAEKLIATQDVAEPEVMLEVEILEIARDRLLELGVQLPGSLTLTPLASSSAGLTVADLHNLKKTSIGAAIDPLKINANATDTDTKTLANPRIRVVNREKAKIVIGNRVPVISATIASGAATTTSESVTYLDVGLKLDLEPTIYLENDIAIRVGLEVNNIISTQTSKLGTVTYTIGTRTANTMLRLKDGENQVLAGLINDDDQRTANKFPGLGDIPVLGRLFGSTKNDGKKSELVLSITPHLIRNIKRPDAAAQEFLSGTEGSFRRRPDFSPRENVAAVTAPPTPASPQPETPTALSSPAPTSIEGARRPAPSTATPARNSKTEILQPADMTVPAEATPIDSAQTDNK
jgi:general secretion pathway protein D